MASGGSKAWEEREKQIWEEREKQIWEETRKLLREELRRSIEEAKRKLEELIRNQEELEKARKEKSPSLLDRLLKSFIRVPDEARHDPYVLELYSKALEKGKEEDRSIRINVVGNFGQGKTSLVRRLVGDSIKGVESTNGIECDQYKCKKNKNGTFSYVHELSSVNAEIGNRLASIAQAMSSQQGSRHEGFIDDDRETSESREALSVKMEDQSHVSKSSVKQQKPKLTKTEGFNEFKGSLNSIKKKSKEANSPTFINIWDFGGQDTFYATHMIFHSRKAIYLLVFNLSLDLKDKVKDGKGKYEYVEDAGDRDMEYFIRFWVHSIHSFVRNKDSSEPYVILVGTHKDKLQGNDQEKESQAEKKFEEVRKLFDKAEAGRHIISADFAVDNTDRNDKSVLLLRETIIKLGEKLHTELVPAKWIPLEKELLKRRQKNKLISMEMLMEIDKENEFPIEDEEQIKLFLKYHHNKGTYCYFDEEPISMNVVLDPQYLIDAFKCIITPSKFCRKDTKLRPFWIKLYEEARLDPELIDGVWERNENREFATHKTILIEFLKKHHILSEAMAFDDVKQTCEELGWYIVPSMLRYKSSDRTIAEYLKGKQKTLTKFVLTFDNDVVVPTIYQRVIAATLGKWPMAQFKDVFLIYENLLVVQLDGYNNGMLEMLNSHIELTIVGLCSSVPIGAVIVDEFRRFVESVVLHELSKRRETTEDNGKPYVPNLRCNDDSHGLGGSKRLIQQFHEKSVEYYPCPDLMSHELVVQQVLSEWFQERSCIQHVPQQKLSDKILSKIACAIGHNWEFLGKQLEVTEIEIQHIKEDYPHSVEMRIYKMLSKWDEQKGDRATMNVLVEQIRGCPEVSVDWDTIRNVIEDINANQ